MTPERLVLDTNVVISGILFPLSVCGRKPARSLLPMPPSWN